MRVPRLPREYMHQYELSCVAAGIVLKVLPEFSIGKFIRQPQQYSRLLKYYELHDHARLKCARRSYSCIRSIMVLSRCIQGVVARDAL